MNIAIIGKGMGWWNYRHESFDQIWAINDIYRYIYMTDNKRICDIVFEMHDFRWSVEDCIRHYKKVEPELSELEIRHRANFKFNQFKIKTREINQFKIDLVSVAAYDFIPTSLMYQKELIVDTVMHGRDYLHGTLAYALAYAIYGKNNIKLFGCNLTGEYFYQQPSVAYLIGVGDERGLKIDIDRSGDSEILKSDFHYGYIESYPQ